MAKKKLKYHISHTFKDVTSYIQKMIIYIWNNTCLYPIEYDDNILFIKGND